MGALGNGLNLLNVSAFWQRVIMGIVIVGVVVFERYGESCNGSWVLDHSKGPGRLLPHFEMLVFQRVGESRYRPTILEHAQCPSRLFPYLGHLVVQPYDQGLDGATVLDHAESQSGMHSGHPSFSG